MAKNRLIVKNFGPIKAVDINLAKVTVFIGEQASGKSVLAKLAALLSEPFDSRDDINDWINLRLKDFNISNFINDDSVAFIKSEKLTFGFQNGDEKIILDDYLNKLFTDLMNAHANLFKNERTYLTLNAPSELDTKQFLKNVDKFSNEAGTAFRQIKTYFSDIVYIPTERNLVSILAQSLFNLLKNEVALPTFVKSFGDKYELNRKILRTLDIPGLNLRYSFQGNEDRIILENGKSIHLVESSSGIQSITPLSVVVEAAGRENGKHLFIIEEPELNLYPTTQKALVEYLIEKCTQGDNRLIITTHSPYILTALNNCIQAKNVVNMHPESAEEVEKLVPSRYHLDYEDIIAYHVAGGTAKPIMNEESKMIDANAIDDVSEQLGSVFDQLLDLKYQNQE